MKIERQGIKKCTVEFGENEQKFCLAVLKGMAKSVEKTGKGFIWDAASDLENDLRYAQSQKLLTFTQYIHNCEDCQMEIDTRKDAHVHQNDKYTHQVCPVLKERTR